ncbi:MAG: hypothetical protein ACXWUX_07925 [Allosphingosinicella sp.]
MIFESAPWRRDLLRDATVLERWLAKPAGERRSVAIEKKMFIGAYAMRRLLESDKLSSSTETKNVRVDRFPSVKDLEKHDRWNIHEHYNLVSGKPVSLVIPRLLNLIIHSFIFQEWHDETENETNFVFTSDTKRNQFLWLMRSSTFVELMLFVANDIPHVHARRFDPERKQWIEWRGKGDPPW